MTLITLDEFIKKYSGKTKGYPTDSDYSGECLSIVKLYMKECFGFNPPPSGTNSAYGYWSKFPAPLGSYFKKVPNTPTGFPKKGSIPIWNTNAGGGHGHIEIALEGATGSSLKSFGQNWGGRHSHITTHNYTNVVGWLEPLNQESTENEPLQSVNQTTESDMEVQELLKKYNVKTLSELDKKIEEHTGTNFSGGYLGSARTEIKQLEGKLAQVTNYVTTLKGQVTNLEKELAAEKASLGGEINRLIEAQKLLQTKADKLQLQVDSHKCPKQEKPNYESYAKTIREQAELIEKYENETISSLIVRLLSALLGRKHE